LMMNGQASGWWNGEMARVTRECGKEVFNKGWVSSFNLMGMSSKATSRETF
jgi:hypothetical protein